MLSYHQRFQQSDQWSRLIDKMNRQQNGTQSVWDTPEYQRWLQNYQATATPWAGGNNMSGNMGSQTSGFNSPLYQQQAQSVLQQQQSVGGGKLAAIADILRKQQGVVPPKPIAPGLTGTAPVAPVNYVQNDRLNAGKGWSKFRNQARGTDQFDAVNKIIQQYFK